ncbi:MAG: alpha/beta hydrolase, partial [Christensenellales bacterium]
SYLTKGINAFVLHYSVGSEINDPLDPLTEASLAMLHIRANAQKYNIDPARVFAVGFSAGGHLAGSLGTLWNDAELQERLPEAGDGNRPTGVVLCYPVISSSNIGHIGSFSNLLRSQTPDAAALERFSLEKHVGAHTSPAFIMHTYDDGLVPVENSLLMAQAYAQAHRPFEMHIYPHGPHGIALANKVTWGGNPDMVCPAAARWVSDSVEWMKTVG